nr:MAG TPA: hypothetical protein [Bacteriophage sp.]
MMGRGLLFIYHDCARGFKVGSIKRKVKQIRCSIFEILGFDSARRTIGFGINGLYNKHILFKLIQYYCHWIVGEHYS